MTDWYADPASRRLILRRYVPWLAGLSLAWELAQLPLYTIWTEALPGYIAFAVAHCTLGDVLIGVAALGVALLVGHEGTAAHWHWPRVVVLTAGSAIAYTAISEWLNTTLYRWTYSPWMPVLAIGDVRLGLSPLAQWMVVVPLALFAARRSR